LADEKPPLLVKTHGKWVIQTFLSLGIIIQFEPPPPKKKKIKKEELYMYNDALFVFFPFLLLNIMMRSSPVFFEKKYM
jgi:hypothetical protein